MRGQASETDIDRFLDACYGIGGIKDTYIFFYGRNALIKKDIVKKLGAARPKLRIQAHMGLVPDASCFADLCKGVSRAAAGSIDLTNGYVKASKDHKTVPGKDRRHLKGNTAYSHCYDVPLPK